MALRDSEAAGLPAIQVSPPQGKLLHLLARMLGARTVLEFGTLGGYSTIWLARALPPGGRLITLEANPDTPRWLAAASSGPGWATSSSCGSERRWSTLPQLDAEGAGPFDLTFIDADKVNTPGYFAWALEHSRPGSLIVADNVVRGGTLARAASDDPATQPSAGSTRRLPPSPGSGDHDPDRRQQGL